MVQASCCCECPIHGVILLWYDSIIRSSITESSIISIYFYCSFIQDFAIATKPYPYNQLVGSEQVIDR